MWSYHPAMVLSEIYHRSDGKYDSTKPNRSRQFISFDKRFIEISGTMFIDAAHAADTVSYN